MAPWEPAVANPMPALRRMQGEDPRRVALLVARRRREVGQALVAVPSEAEGPADGVRVVAAPSVVAGGVVAAVRADERDSEAEAPVGRERADGARVDAPAAGADVAAVEAALRVLRAVLAACDAAARLTRRGPLHR